MSISKYSMFLGLLAIVTVTQSCAGPAGSTDVQAKPAPTRTPVPKPAIHVAIDQADIDGLKVVLKNGADVEEEYIGRTPLWQATFDGNAEMVSLLAEAGADVNKRDALGQTPLFMASNVAVAQALVDHGAQIDIVDSQDQPLLTAICHRNPEVVQFLVESGANLELTDKRNRSTVLMVASSQGQTELVTYLLSRDVDVNTLSAHGETALAYAAAHGNTEVAKLLIEHGADVNVVCPISGRTALHTSAADGYLEFVQLLLKNGADPKIQDVEGLTPLGVALAYSPYPGRVSKPTNKEEVIRLLRSAEKTR